MLVLRPYKVKLRHPLNPIIVTLIFFHSRNRATEPKPSFLRIFRSQIETSITNSLKAFQSFPHPTPTWQMFPNTIRPLCGTIHFPVLFTSQYHPSCEEEIIVLAIDPPRTQKEQKYCFRQGPWSIHAGNYPRPMHGSNPRD